MKKIEKIKFEHSKWTEEKINELVDAVNEHEAWRIGFQKGITERLDNVCTRCGQNKDTHTHPENRERECEHWIGQSGKCVHCEKPTKKELSHGSPHDRQRNIDKPYKWHPCGCGSCEDFCSIHNPIPKKDELAERLRQNCIWDAKQCPIWRIVADEARKWAVGVIEQMQGEPHESNMTTFYYVNEIKRRLKG